MGKLAGKPVFRNAPIAGHQKTVNATNQIGMLGGGNIAIVGDLADFPQSRDGFARRCETDDVAIARHRFERQHVGARLRARQALAARHGVERAAQCVERSEIELAIAPLQHAHRFEIVIFDAIDGFSVEGFGLAGDAECSIVQVAAGAARNLARVRPD